MLQTLMAPFSSVLSSGLSIRASITRRRFKMADNLPSVPATKTKSGKRHSKSVPSPSPEAIPSTSRQAPFKAKGRKDDSKGHPEKPKGSRAAERDERCRDRALEKLWAQSISKNAGNQHNQSEGARNTRKRPEIRPRETKANSSPWTTLTFP